MAMLTSLHPKYLSRYSDFAGILFRHGGRDLLDRTGLGHYLRGREDDPALSKQRNARELVADLEELGPTFVKFGQVLSSQADMLPIEYLEALSRLHDRVEPFPFETVRAIIREELELDVEQAYARFDAEPVAAASLGQVHRALLHDGRDVAVKIQRPDVRQSMADDLGALEQIAAFLDDHTDLGRRYRFRRLIRQLRRTLTRELDYEREASNLEVFAQNLANFKLLVIPRPIDSLTSRRVLTMERIAGINVSEVEGDLGDEGRKLLEQLFHAYLQQILVDGVFHADPHPGNVMLMEDGRLGLIDLGMTGFVDPTLRESLLQLLLAVSEGRAGDASQVAIDMGTMRGEFEAAAFRRDLAEAIGEHHEASVKRMQIGRLVAAVCRTAGEHGLEIPQAITLLGKMLLNLDQVARCLSPNFDTNHAIRRHAGEMALRRLMGSLTPQRFLSNVLGLKSFAEDLPMRVNRVLDMVSDNTFRMNVDALDEDRLISGLEKIASRIGVGLILAAMIVGSAILMRGSVGFTILGYPGLGFMIFVIAVLSALTFIVKVLWSDLNEQRRSRHRH